MPEFRMAEDTSLLGQLHDHHAAIYQRAWAQFQAQCQPSRPDPERALQERLDSLIGEIQRGAVPPRLLERLAEVLRRAQADGAVRRAIGIRPADGPIGGIL